MKAILVIDAPDRCEDCLLHYFKQGDYCCPTKKLIEDDINCPLRPVHALKSCGHDYIIYERQYLYDNLEREIDLLQKARDWEKQNESRMDK